MAPQNEPPTILVENAKLIFRNLAGREREFNSEGDRNFSVLLEPEKARKLLKEGWRVKQLKPRDGEEEGDYHLKVKLNYKTGRPPRVVLINGGVRTELGPDEVGIIDACDIGQADVFINGWWSDMAGGGYSAFLKSLFVTVHLDPLELKYAEENQTPVVEEEKVDA